MWRRGTEQLASERPRWGRDTFHGRTVFVCFVLPGGGGDGWCRRHSSTMVTRHYVLWVQQCPRLCTVVSSTVWMTVRGGGRRCVGFGWAKQQVPSPWGENQFKPHSEEVDILAKEGAKFSEGHKSGDAAGHKIDNREACGHSSVRQQRRGCRVVRQETKQGQGARATGTA